MKRALIKLLTSPYPIRVLLARRIISLLRVRSYVDHLAIGDLDRPHYGYCIFQAARLANLLNYPRISVIEFGCGGGNGLVTAEMHIREISKLFPVEIELYGFDTGTGMPRPQDYRDMPHYFQPGFYKMDRQILEKKLTLGKLVIGDVKDTCTTFFHEYDPAPVGCIFYDLDFYSATRDAFMLLNADTSHFLPRIFTYFDDIIGDDIWLCNEFTGERLAIEEFNREHASQKIARCYHLAFHYPNSWWPQQVYVYHDFGHPRYNDYVGAEEQSWHAASIRLK